MIVGGDVVVGSDQNSFFSLALALIRVENVGFSGLVGDIIFILDESFSFSLVGL